MINGPLFAEMTPANCRSRRSTAHPGHVGNKNAICNCSGDTGLKTNDASPGHNAGHIDPGAQPSVNTDGQYTALGLAGRRMHSARNRQPPASDNLQWLGRQRHSPQSQPVCNKAIQSLMDALECTVLAPVPKKPRSSCRALQILDNARIDMGCLSVSGTCWTKCSIFVLPPSGSYSFDIQ